MLSILNFIMVATSCGEIGLEFILHVTKQPTVTSGVMISIKCKGIIFGNLRLISNAQHKWTGLMA